jgi:hypothetical protein
MLSEKMDNSAIWHDLMGLTTLVRDLKPSTPKVIAEMLFEKLNLILAATHND